MANMRFASVTAEAERVRPWQTAPNRIAHPARVSAIAQLNGLPCEAGAFSYLQIGAGDGGHLFGLATVYPESRFVGVEASPTVRAEAADVAERCELSNLSFEDERFLDRAAGAFDFVAWLDGFTTTAPAERAGRLEACARVLNPRGIGLLGYDVLPGARCLDMAVKVLGRVAGMAKAAPTADVRAALSMLRDAPAGGRGIELLRPELDALHALDDQRLERLISTPSAPIMFWDFASELQAAGLVYLCEAAASEMNATRAFAASYPALTASSERLEREQYLDIVSGRRTRRSLVVKTGHAPTPTISTAQLEQLSCLSPLRRVSTSPGAHSFSAPGGVKVQLTDPILAASLDLLGQAFPRALAYHELRAGLASQLGAAPDVAGLKAAVLAGYQRELLDLMLAPPRCASQAPERPRVSALTRVELAQGRPLTSRLHFQVTPRRSLTRALIPLLDGARTVDDLAALVAPPTESMAPSRLAELVSDELASLTRQGLLVPE